MAKAKARARSEIGARIREAAGSVGLNLRDLGDRLGVSRPTMYAYSTGALALSEERIRQLSEITGRPAHFFEVDSENVEGGHDFDLLKRTIDALVSAPDRLLATTLALRGAKIERERGELLNCAELELKAGNALLAEGSYLEAVERLTSAREIFMGQSKPELAARCSQSLGYALINLGRLERARAAFLDSEAKADPKCVWKGTVSLAALAEREGQFEAAESRLNDLLSKESPRTGAFAYSNFSLATLMGSKGDFRSAYELNRRCLELALAGGYKDQVIERYVQLGTACLWIGSYEEASLWLMRTVDGATQLGDAARLTFGNLAVARLHMQCGNLKDARQICVDALSEATAKEYRRSEATALGLLAEIAFARSDWEQARDYGLQAASFCKNHSYPAGEFVSRAVVASSLVNLGELDRGRSAWKQAHGFSSLLALPFYSAVGKSTEARILAAEKSFSQAVVASQQAVESLSKLGLMPILSGERLRLATYLERAGKDKQSKEMNAKFDEWDRHRSTMKIHLGLPQGVVTEVIGSAGIEVGFSYG